MLNFRSGPTQIMAESVLIAERRHPPRLLLAWLPALLWMAMIAWGSSERFSSVHTYWWLRALWQWFHWPVGMLGTLNVVLRKTGHFCVYGMLSVFLFFAWRETLRNRFAPRLMWSPRIMLLALTGAVLVASGDEFHQTFLPGRTGVVHDVFLDALGAAFAQMLLLALLYGRRSRSR